MSYAGKVKKELLEQTGRARHCQIAELAALFSVYGQIIWEENGNNFLKFVTENLTVAQKYYILIKKVFHIIPDISLRGRHQYFVFLFDEQSVGDFMNQVMIYDSDVLVADGLIQRACCKRAFLRGFFLAAGSVSDPNSSYHLELMAGSRARAVRIRDIMGEFGMDAKMVERKQNYVVYIKEGESIVDFLNVVGAHVALMEFENVRILKEMRNSINRRVNCETANIKKTVSASSRQVEEIRYIYDTIGFGTLSENLREIAELRIENPDVTLKELGEMLDPPIGKSGVNHRLRKLSEIAAKLREDKNENFDGGNHD